MQRRMNIQASSSVIISCMITILIQFAAYYFFHAYFMIWGISCLISIICCHIILEQTSTYIACFNYSMLTIFISLVIIVITYFGDVRAFLPYTSAMLGIALINWMVPVLHCFIRKMLDYGTKVDDYKQFFLSSNILFLLFYFGLLIYGNFAGDAFPWAYSTSAQSADFFPFVIISSKLEHFLNGQIPLSSITTYLMSRILTYTPYGFFIAFMLRRQKRLPKFFALLFMPFIIEVLQYILIPGRCDIDDLIYAVIGGLLGCFLFFLTNVIYRGFTGRDFLANEADYHFNPLHF